MQLPLGRFRGRPTWRLAGLAAAMLTCGCALHVPTIAPDHPAREEAASGPIPDPPAVLDVARADRHDPTSRPSTLLHLDMPMQEGGATAHEDHP